MPITLLPSSPNEVGTDQIREKLNELINSLTLSISPVASSPSQISIDEIRIKINELLQVVEDVGGFTVTNVITTVNGEDILLTDGTTLDLA